MAEKYIMLNIDDERTKNLADVISNSTSKKILNLLSEREEASEADVAKALSLPINSVGYNLKKLEKAGLVEVKNVLWSVKGRKVRMYKLSKKMIIIGTKGIKLTNSFKGIATILLSGLGAVAVRQYYITKQATYNTLQAGAEAAPTLIKALDQSARASTASGNPWLWFFAGSIFALAVYLILNIKKSK